mmetsp:Transcript_17756/g.44753  ORF Transcript_17756/g.44753 Transcript_17756/m.44753 type:complete len:243 (-) Transcript_17756:878-1606(-)
MKRTICTQQCRMRTALRRPPLPLCWQPASAYTRPCRRCHAASPSSIAAMCSTWLHCWKSCMAAFKLQWMPCVRAACTTNRAGAMCAQAVRCAMTARWCCTPGSCSETPPVVHSTCFSTPLGRCWGGLQRQWPALISSCRTTPSARCLRYCAGLGRLSCSVWWSMCMGMPWPAWLHQLGCLVLTTRWCCGSTWCGQRTRARCTTCPRRQSRSPATMRSRTSALCSGPCPRWCSCQAPCTPSPS